MSGSFQQNDDFDQACLDADKAISKMFATFPKNQGIFVLWRPGFLISRLKKLEKRMEGNRRKGQFKCQDCKASVCVCTPTDKHGEDGIEHQPNWGKR